MLNLAFIRSREPVFERVEVVGIATHTVLVLE